MKVPVDADVRRAIKPVICYPNETLPKPNMEIYRRLSERFDQD